VGDGEKKEKKEKEGGGGGCTWVEEKRKKREYPMGVLKEGREKWKKMVF
jgi:hypothetical protein